MIYSNLKRNCLKLENFLKHDFLFDIDGLDLFAELEVLKEVLRIEIQTPVEVINFIKKIKLFSQFMDCL